MAKHDALQGTLALVVLRALSRGPLHGYGITASIQRVSNELLRVEEGSLYPALHRMEEAGWVTSEWGQTDTGRRARFYSITAAGERQLAEERAQWERLTSGVEMVLQWRTA
ncbi:MAG: PadR family transcriptional regulator [Gemmatimonadales bacterium]